MQILIPYLHKRKSTTFFHRLCSICNGGWYDLFFIFYTHEIRYIFVQSIRHITNEFLSLYFKKLRRVAELVEFWTLFSVCVSHLPANHKVWALLQDHTAQTTRRAQFTRHTASTSNVVHRPPGTAQTVAHHIATPGVTCADVQGVILILSGNVSFVGSCTSCEIM